MSRVLSVEVFDKSPLKIGSKLYVIGRQRDCEYKVFREKCPICGDTKYIEINGFRFKCPLCQRGQCLNPPAGDLNGTSLLLCNYVVHEFIINRFEVIGNEYKSSYTKDGLKEGEFPVVKWYGFCRWGNGSYNVVTREFKYACIHNSVIKVPEYANDMSGEAFYLKEDAELFRKRLHDKQKELLKSFNASHGTDHSYPFSK